MGCLGEKPRVGKRRIEMVWGGARDNGLKASVPCKPVADQYEHLAMS